jgi:hypothetical protein
MKKPFIIAIVFFVGLAFGLILGHGSLRAEDAKSDPDVMIKLKEISKSIEEVKAAVNDIKDELRIVKIRVTQLQ